MADIPLSEGYNTKLRRETIKRLILSEAIGTQNELTEKLKAAGFPTTQSTVSRDIRELHLVKISGKNGKYYAVTEESQSDAADERFERLYRTVVKKAVKAMNIVVIRTTVGMAQGLCVYLDRMPFDGIAGTLAGDDTILMIMESEETASALMGVLPQM
ncbi:MAG: arginine repressor [Lachnospiraceae bacterium]|jgi:transcriptional regulator of arginine metabolism|nr:arginine repressor [Lachnospiraceae bacterium]MBQ6195895.1 arginine repressor [Lachnospiraceae bacterium]